MPIAVSSHDDLKLRKSKGTVGNREPGSALGRYAEYADVPASNGNVRNCG
jgi:hypothetical protein